MLKKFAVLLMIIALVASLALAIAAPALAANPRCDEVPGQGWHIVGGGGLNDHWFETEAACLAALNPEPTATEPTATEEPTETPDPTQEPTNTPTEEPTGEPTFPPTDEPTTTPVVTGTPSAPTSTPVAPVAGDRGGSCQQAWDKIVNLIHKDEGYRYFENPEHAWCQPWLKNKHGIDYWSYKALNP